MRTFLVSCPIVVALMMAGCGSSTLSSPDSAIDAMDTVGSDAGGEPGPGDSAIGEGTDSTDASAPGSILGLPLEENGVLYAGAAAIEITPDLDMDGSVYLAGFGKDRLAKEVRDPLWARALVLARDREYVAVVALDLLGMTGYRSGLAADELAGMGWAPERLVVHTTHTHAGPDTLGMWGPDTSHTGLNPAYQDSLVDAVVKAVKAAAGSAVPVSMKAGSVRVGSVSPYFTSPEFGGKGSVGRMTGLIRDSRDPVTTDDTLTAFGLFNADGKAVAAVAHVHTHPEVSGGGHDISSDFPNAVRNILESRFGGVGILWNGAVGGLQTPLGVPMPATDADGAIIWADCDQEAIEAKDPECQGADPGDPRVDADGDSVPSWTSEDDWDRTDSYGRLLGGLAADLIESASVETDPEMELKSVPLMLPIQNRYLQVFGRSEDTSILDPLVELVDTLYPEYKEYIQELYDTFDAAILDFPEDHMVKGKACPLEAEGEVVGCLPSRMWFLRLGPVQVLTVPGELLPELWIGTPPGAKDEYADASLRGPGSTWFGYSDPACAKVPYEQCRTAIEVDGCDCLNAHAAPYRLSPDDPDAPPLASRLDAKYPVLLGLTGEMTGYIIPEPDNTLLLSRPLDEMFGLPGVLDTVAYGDDAGDHYEESVSLGPALATILQKAAADLFND
ncbi:MAG: hypothetical protein GXP54_11925 [Deltaproteobacteria bacterium]|nr:hypothetical protein [Deltaproteobacteria bacterium]